MGERIRSFDWATHPLGPPERWPPGLITALGICLNSSFPTAIYWGPELRLLYNDAWSPIPADRHPAALGRPAKEVWHDIWDVVGPQLEAVVSTGTGFSTFDQMLPMQRRGIAEETYWNYSFTPIIGEKGAVAGVFNQGHETTRQVLATRERAAETQRLRETFQQAPGAIAVLRGPEHKFEVANAAYIELIGGRSELIGRSVSEALPEVIEQGFIDLLDTVYRSGEPHIGNGVPVVLQRGGKSETRFLDFIYQPMRDSTGAVTGIFVQAGDVTERTIAERSLRQRAQERDFLDRLAEATQLSTDADTILSTITRLTGEHLKVSICAYADMDPDGDGFTIRGDWSAPSLASIVGHYSLADFGALAVANLNAGRPLIIADNRLELAQPEAAAFQALGITATICMPLIKGGRLTALMAVHDTAPRIWTEDEVALIRDVTERSWAHIERVGAEHEARESEYRYRALFNAIDEGFCVIEFIDGPHGPLSDYVHVEANAAYTLHAGIPDVVGKKVRNMVGEEADGWIELYRRVLLTGEPIRFERELVATGRWLELAAFRMEPPSRRQVAVLFQDLTARRRAEFALRASEENFRTLARVMPNQAWTATPQGKLDWFNEQVYKFSEAEPDSLKGEGWLKLLHTEDLAATVQRWQAALASGEPYEAEFRIRRGDGAFRWHIARAVPIKTELGDVIRWIGTNTDIHDQKTIAETLEQRVNERTHQLMAAEEALRQSQKMEAVGQLTGGIAHDFNNMLAVVIGSLNLMQRRLKKGDLSVERYVDSAMEGAKRAASLTQRLLAFARQQPLEPVVIDANKLVASMTDLLTRTLGEHIRVETVLSSGLWRCFADQVQLESAILNLAVNARDAMADGGRLTVDTANALIDAPVARNYQMQEGQYVVIAISDTGTGMTPEIVARAFDPFYTTKPVGKGSGLGLSQVFGFMRQSRGHVKLYSEVGVGTTVKLYLPRYSGSVEPETVAPLSATFATGDRSEVVLVVEDDERVRNYSADALRELGYGVIVAEGPQQALALLDGGQRCDVLFTDIVMPDMNGRQLADLALKKLPELKVLFTTGYTRNAVVHNGVLDAGTAFLQKPFTVEQLADKMRQVLDGFDTGTSK
jgi:PAS domain S-box-containing protein